MRSTLLVAAIALTAFALCVLAPLRQLSGDTVPARIGGAVLRCAGDFDLAHVDWVRAETDRQREFYYTHEDETGAHTSVFGPVPAVVVMLALFDFGDGDRIDDHTLRARERGAGALLFAIAVALIVLAALARVSPPRAALTGLACALSFAGAASLGQGMWQATTALPFLTGALATLAWRDRRPQLALVTPALVVLSVMLRPTIAPLALGLGIAWARDTKTPRTWLIAAAIALACATPLVVWNAIHLWSPLPIGQWTANARETEHVFTLAGAATGIAGLLVSPARGLVWFAPIALVGAGFALRSRPYRWIAAGIALQLVAMALFFKWHGGQAYGPRLLAEATWVGCWLALGTELRAPRWLLGVTLAITIVVGQLGLWRFMPEQWELPVRPEAHPSAFWTVIDSPIPATLRDPPRGGPQANDSPQTRGLVCDQGTLRSATP